jgi:hypothetical protein
MLSTSLMDELEVFQYPPPILPAFAAIRELSRGADDAPFDVFLLNTAVLALFTVVGRSSRARPPGTHSRDTGSRGATWSSCSTSAR